METTWTDEGGKKVPCCQSGGRKWRMSVNGTTQDLEQKILKLCDIFLNIWKTIIVR